MGCASIKETKPYFYTLEMTSDYKIVSKTKSYGFLKPHPPNRYFRYWVYDKDQLMIYKGAYDPLMRISFPGESLHEENLMPNDRLIVIRVPAESKTIRFLTRDMEEVTTVTIK